MDQWEYKVVGEDMEKGFFKSSPPAEGASQTLNALGREGWELVGVAPVAGEGLMTKSFLLFLKRKVG